VIDAMKNHATNSSNPISQLKKILGVSDSLAKTAQNYWKAMQNGDGNDANASAYPYKPCGFAFAGVAYAGLDISRLSNHSIEYLQDHLRIVDPLYGWLKPMDVIEAYRLEMASRGVFDTGNNNNAKKKKSNASSSSSSLAQFWKPAIRESLHKEESELQQGGDGGEEGQQSRRIVIVNLASDEYSAAVDWPLDKMVKVIFRHAGRVVAVHAKHARGLMARYMAEHFVATLDSLVKFDLEGYTFRPEQSSSLDISRCGQDDDGGDKEMIKLVFDRPADWNKAAVKSANTSRKRK
jgi:hypothetical protein